MFGEMNEVPDNIQDRISIGQVYSYLNESIDYTGVAAVRARISDNPGPFVDFRAIQERRQENDNKIRNPLFSSSPGTVPVLLATQSDHEASIVWTGLYVIYREGHTFEIRQIDSIFDSSAKKADILFAKLVQNKKLVEYLTSDKVIPLLVSHRPSIIHRISRFLKPRR